MMAITGMAAPLIAGVMLVSLLDLVSPFVNEVSRWSRKGEASYRDKAWAQAKDFYDRAALDQPGGVREYNRGEAAYQEGKFDEALAALGRASAAKEIASGRVAYDSGNAQFRKGDYAGAKESYRRALRENPDDEDARANYELALHLEQKPQSSPKGKDSKSDAQGERSPSPSDSSPGNSASPPQPQEGDQNGRGDSQAQESPPAPPDSSSRSAEGREGQASTPEQMSPTEAKRLLNAVTPKEREFLEARLKAARRKRAEKDW